MKPDKRKPFAYREVTITPQIGTSRYFGCPHGEYLSKWWQVSFGPESWVLVGTKSDARRIINKTLDKPGE